MNKRASNLTPPPEAEPTREERLQQALRANLRRRKAVSGAQAPKAGDSEPSPR